MEKGKLTVIYFDKSDVIATSQIVVSLSGIWDSTVGNALLTYKGNSYSAAQLADLNTALAGTGLTITGDTNFNASKVTKNVTFLTKTDATSYDKGADSGYTHLMESSGFTFNRAFYWDEKAGMFRVLQ